jgi:hypothetical protein
MFSTLFPAMAAGASARDALRADMAASRAASAAAQSRTEVQLLRQDVERLLMICEALWGVLKEQHGWTDQELVRRIQEIDLADGQLDGKVAPQPPAVCPQCSRTLNRRRSTCLYCGTEVEGDPFER